MALASPVDEPPPTQTTHVGAGCRDRRGPGPLGQLDRDVLDDLGPSGRHAGRRAPAQLVGRSPWPPRVGDEEHPAAAEPVDLVADLGPPAAPNTTRPGSDS